MRTHTTNGMSASAMFYARTQRKAKAQSFKLKIRKAIVRKGILKKSKLSR